MTNREELLNKAKYIQFPFMNEKYKEYNVNGINKLPIVNNKCLYSEINGDNHHYTTDYHIKYVFPLLSKLLDFDFNIDDFDIQKVLYSENGKSSDLSYLSPKQEYKYNVVRLNDGYKFNDISFDGGLVFNEKVNKDKKYRGLFFLPHECCSIHNTTLKNGRKLFLSGDSQIIPEVSFLSCYFEEVWYFDNRTARIGFNIDYEKTSSFEKYWKDVNFTNVLISLYWNPLYWYTKVNFK